MCYNLVTIKQTQGVDKMKTFTVKLVKQHVIRDKQGKLVEVSRYNTSNELLYKQNRSHDITVPMDEYLFTMSNFIDLVKSKGNTIKIYEVAENSKWITV